MHYDTPEASDPRRRNSAGMPSAMSLVEVMVAVTLVSILLVVVTALAIRLRQWDRQVRENGRRGEQLARLAESLRDDVRRASKITLSSKNTITLAGSDTREILYQLKPDGCRRLLKNPGKAAAATEVFSIGFTDSWKLKPDPGGRRPAYTISLARIDSEKTTPQSVPLYVYAVLGSDMP